MLNLDDNAEKIIYNASAYADVSDRELGAFLRFVSEDYNVKLEDVKVLPATERM